MEDKKKTKAQLITELEKLRKRNAEIETAETERKKAKETLATEMQKLDRIIDGIHAGLILLDSETKVIWANDIVQEWFGTLDDMMGQCCYKFYGLKNPEKECAAMLAGKSGKTEKGECFVKIIGGEEKYFQIITSPLFDSEGKVMQFVELTVDITERKKAEEELQNSELFLKKAQKVAHIGNWSWDLQANKLKWSDENYRIFGLSKDVVPTYENFEKTIHPDDLEFVNKSVEKALKDKILYNIDFRIILPGNKVRVVNAIGEVNYNKDGKPLMFWGTVQDITERKKAEEKISAITQKSPIPTAVGSSDGSIISFNEALERLIGYKRDEINDTKDWAEKLYPDKGYRDFVLNNIQQSLRGEKQDCTEFTITCKNGTTKLIDFHTSFFQDGLIIQMVDITERKKAEEALRESEEKYRQLFSTESDAIILFDAKTLQIIDINKSSEILYGYSREEFLSLKLPVISPESKNKRFLIKNTIAGKLKRIPLYYHKKKNGTTFPVEISTSSFKLQNRQILCGNCQRHNRAQTLGRRTCQSEQTRINRPSCRWDCP